MNIPTMLLNLTPNKKAPAETDALKILTKTDNKISN